MAIGIPSLNIRRLYTEEENKIANSIHENNRLIEDILTFKKLKELSRIGKVQANDLSELDLDGFLLSYVSEYVDKETGEIITFRDSKKVKKVEKFVKNNEKKISNEVINTFSRQNPQLKELRRQNRDSKKLLDESLQKGNPNRELNSVFPNDYVAISSSALTSALNMEDDTRSNDIIILTVDQEHMMTDVILNDFKFNGEQYELYGASAGQLRKKKIMFVNLEKLKCGIHKLINGLTIEKINKTKVGDDEDGNPIYGVNINKWSAYMSLPTSATTIWEEVDLNRVCVVDDFETVLKNRDVDFIDRNYEISRVKKDVVIPHTDGFGMMHPRFCRDTRIIRAPWIKGLLAPMDYRSFATTFDGKRIIKDLWGVEYNIDDIDIILTKSQFKMWKYYESWQDYVTRFYKNECEFRYMIPESKKDLRLNALFNYQMWQTLIVDNPKKVAEYILKEDMELIEKAHCEVGAMKTMFGVNKEYNKNSNINKALYLYPNMLHHNYFKKSLNDNLSARKSDLAEGRVKINGVYTFLIPDTFAWCQHLFLDEEEPEGILNDGEVSCKLMPKNKEILVNRSPHLHRIEHCVKENIKEKIHIRWFITKGVYTSVHDIISKRLFFDVDGDIALVVDNEELIKMAKRTTEGLLPLDFELGKAKPQIINRKNILSSYIDAFKANIGYYSNLITKVLNSDNKDIDLVAKFCWMNNMAIDRAKTNFFIEPTEDVGSAIKDLKSTSLPYFFHWAKDKDINSVNPPNEDSLVDNMAIHVFGDLKSEDKSKRRYIRFSYRHIPKFDVKLLLRNPPKSFGEDADKELISKLRKVSDTKYHTIIKKKMQKDDDYTDVASLDGVLKRETYDYLNAFGADIDDVVDFYVDYCFENNLYISMLFVLFGDIIVERLENRFSELLDGGFVRCDVCGKIVNNSNGRAMYCDKCKEKIQLKWQRESMAKNRKLKKCEVLQNRSKR